MHEAALNAQKGFGAGPYLTCRDVTTGATGATEVAPRFSETLTLSQLRGADFAHHCKGRT